MRGRNRTSSGVYDPPPGICICPYAGQASEIGVVYFNYLVVKGLGKAFAVVLLEAGASVCLSDVNPESGIQRCR